MSDNNENMIPTCILRLLYSTYLQTSKLYALNAQNEKAGVNDAPAENGNCLYWASC